MRLRAVLQGGKRLQEVLRALERTAKMVTVLMCPAEISLVANPNSVDSLQVWASLPASGADGDGVFKTYRIESLNSNKIGFEADIAQFQRALKTAEHSEVATIKLSNKNGRPFMTFEIIVKTGDLLMTSIQDVPVRLLSVDEHNSTNEPDIGDPTVKLVVPDLRPLSNVTDRLKHLDSKINLKANMAGELEFGAATDFAFMTNYWKELQSPAVQGVPAVARDPSQKAEVVVDCGMLARIFQCHHLRPSLTVCCIVERGLQKLLVWHVIIFQNETITYYCPVLD